MANSSMFSLPSMTAPAPNRRDVTVDSYSGLKPARMREAACDGTPLVQNKSLMPKGMPHKSGATPLASRASAARA